MINKKYYYIFFLFKGLKLKKIAFIALILSSKWVFSTSYTWDTTAAPNGGTWSTNANWTPSTGFPIAGDTATITKNTVAATAFTVTLGSQAVNNINLSFSNTGAQTLTLSSGSLTINAPTNPIFAVTAGSADSALINWGTSIVLLGGSIANFNIDANCSLVMQAEMAGQGDITKNGSGDLTFATNNTYGLTTRPATTINAGSLTLTSSGILPSGGLLINGGSLIIAPSAGSKSTGSLSGNSGTTVNLNNNTFTISNGPTTGYAGVITGAGGSIIKLLGSPWILTGANDYTGSTTINNCQISLSGSASALGNGAALSLINGGQLVIEAGAGNKTIGALSGVGTITLNENTLTINQGSDGTYAGVISGTGGLTKSGANTLNLTGVNNYSGLTTISAGTLTFAGDTSSLSGLMTNNAAVVFNQSTASTFGQAISGTGTLTKSGAGNLTLSGVNDYSGLSTISAGTLTFTANTASMSGLMTNNAAVVFNQSAASTFSQAISGTGTLTKSGAGNLTLSGVNTYSGLTTISAGTLTFTVNTASMSGLMTNNAAVVFNQSVDSTFGQAISGTGTLTKSGAGNLTLSGVNNYSGLTTISAGTLTFTASTASMSGLMTNNAAVVFNQSAASTFGQAISGTGTLTKSGTGNLTLAAVNDYSGLTTISAGTLTFTASTASMSGLMTNNAAVVFNQSADSAFGQAISGTGTLIKNGAGNLTLSGFNDYSGLTTISAGTLTFTASTASLSGLMTNNAAVVFNQSAASTFGQAISGTGTLTKSGAGNLTLSAVNNYSGLTTISAGTLTFTANTASMSGLMTNNAAVVFNQSSDSAFGQAISGTGTLTKNGAGNLTLSGVNDYSGLTTISAGTLTFTASTASLSGLMTNNAAVVFNQSSNSAFGQAISGTGTLTKIGAGNLTLSAVNNYSGLTTISAGTLTFANDTSGLTGLMTNNAAVVFNQSSDSAFNHVISGIGTLTKSGAGNLTLSAVNDYSGLTTISAGTLTFTGDTSSMSGLMTNNAAVVFNQSASSTFAQAISGTGTLTKSGIGNLTLSGVNDYSGLTTINAGGITLSGGGTIGASTAPLLMSGGTFTIAAGAGAKEIGNLSGSSGPIALNNNTLTITQSSDLTFTGLFTGTSSANIVKQGGGKLTLTGTSSGFVGDTTIDAGTIAINGTLNGETTVNANGRLQGVGILNNLRNLGTVSPGNSIGTLTITGDFTMVDPAAILEIEIDINGTCDQLIVTGTANLDGYVHLLPNSGIYVGGQQFLILTAGSVTGDFLGIVESSPQDFRLFRSGNNIYVLVNSDFVISPLADLLTGNAKLTYEYLICTKGNDAELFKIQNLLVALPTLQEFSDALVQLCPALYSSLPLLELQNNVHMAQVMTQKNRKYFCDCNHGKKAKYQKDPQASFWVQPLGFYYNQKGVQNQYGFHDHTYGAAFGFLMPLPSGVLLDLGLGYTYSKLKWNNNRGSADSDTIYFAPALTLWFNPFCLSFIVQGDVNFYNAKRNIEFTGVNETALSNFQSYDVLCGVDFSAKLEIPDPYHTNAPFYIEPQMQLYCMNFFQQRFIEKDGGDLNLSVGHKHSVFLQPNLGFKITQEFKTKRVCFAPNLYVGYLANIPLSNSGYQSSIPAFSIPCFSDFTVYGYDRVTNQLSLGIEFVMKRCDRFLLTCGYNATMFSHIFTQGISLRLSFEF